MMGKNRFGKYLLYAIGEIVLVVIGIFIAIQLNGLKNKSQQKEKNLLYLKQLHEEVSYNSERSTFLLDSDSMRAVGGDLVVDHLVAAIRFDSLIATKIVPEQMGLVSFTLQINYNHPRFQRTVYENGISTGALFNINDLALIEHIQMYYTLLEDDLRWVMDAKAGFISEFKKAKDHRYLMWQMRNLVNDYPKGHFEQNEYEWLNELDKLLSKEEFDQLVRSNGWLFDPTSSGYRDMVLYSNANWNYCRSLRGAYTRTIMSSDSLCYRLAEEIHTLEKGLSE